MKKQILFEAINDLDPRYIEEGEQMPKKTFSGIKAAGTFAGIAAAAALLTLIGTALYNHNHANTIKAPIEKHVTKDNTSKVDEIAKVFHWEEMENVQRFKTLSYNNTIYTTALILVHDEYRGISLGTGTLSGYDIYTDTFHTTEGKLISISGISSEAAVAVAFPDEPDRYYAFTNIEYTPATLSDFIDALNLHKELKTGLVYVKNSTEPKTVYYEDISSEYIWSTLLSDQTIVNEPNANPGKAVLSISASVDVLGYHNKTITLTEDGYLWTNLLESGKYFKIGEDKVNAFIKEVTGKHQGYIYIYDYTTPAVVAE